MEISRNKIPFLTSISNHIHYRTTMSMGNMNIASLEVGLENIIRCYALRRFNIVVVLVDIQFKYLKDRNKIGKSINIVTRGEYIKHIE